MSSKLTVNNIDELPPDDCELDEASFETLFKSHYQRLCIYCKIKYGFDVPVAEDLVNTAFVKLWQARHTVNMNEGCSAYIYRIVDNLCLNSLKHRKVRQKHELRLQSVFVESDMQVSFDSIDLKELRNAINSAVSELPVHMREIFELSRYEGLKYNEIAERLGVSVKTVETQMSRALSKLRDKLSGYVISLIFLIVNSFLVKYFF